VKLTWKIILNKSLKCFSFAPDYEATLVFKVKESQEEKEKRRDQKLKEKERKKLEREKRILNYGSSKKGQ